MIIEIRPVISNGSKRETEREKEKERKNCEICPNPKLLTQLERS